jgi:hypothetical protein
MHDKACPRAAGDDDLSFIQLSFLAATSFDMPSRPTVMKRRRDQRHTSWCCSDRPTVGKADEHNKRERDSVGPAYLHFASCSLTSTPTDHDAQIERAPRHVLHCAVLIYSDAVPCVFLSSPLGHHLHIGCLAKTSLHAAPAAPCQNGAHVPGA